MMHWWYAGGMGSWGYVLMAVGMAAFWVVVVVLVVAVLRSMSRGQRRRGSGSSQTPEEILAARFAAGEISEQEYQERLSVLAGRSGSMTG